MKLAYKYYIPFTDEIKELCIISKNLYNQTLYEVRQNLFKNSKFIFYDELNKLMPNIANLEGNVNYRLLKTQVAQQIIKKVNSDLTNYIRSIKDYSINKHKYKGKPNLPKYKRTKYNQLIYTNQCAVIKNNKIYLSKNLILDIPQFKEQFINFNQITITPKNNRIAVSIIYKVDELNDLVDPTKFSSIDLGVNNLASMIIEGKNPLIFSGKQLKSVNQFYNKQKSELCSIKDKMGIKLYTKKLYGLENKREDVFRDLFHKLSRFIVNYLIENKIGNLVVGYNKNWKDSIELGNKTNQTFVSIPYLKLINYLKYKCKLVGINLILNEESYTSKCDGLALESLEKQDEYLGKRVKRGLFQSSIGKLINADINGALNILRKVVGDSVSQIINSGLLFNPVKIRDLYDLNSLQKELLNCVNTN